MTRCFANRLPFKIQDKACVCGTPLFFKITTLVRLSLQGKKQQHEVHVDVCDVAMLVDLLLLSLCLWWLLSWSWSVPWLSCACSVAVMYPLSCVHCYVFNVNVLLSRHVRLLKYAIFLEHLREIIRRGLGGPKNTSDRYRKICNSPRHPCVVELLREIQMNVTIRGIKPEEFEDRIIFVSMFNDIDWSQGKDNSGDCFSSSQKVRHHAKRSQKAHWSFLGLGDEEKRYGTHDHKPEGKWNHTADVMELNFEESGHPVFRASSALDRRL